MSGWTESVVLIVALVAMPFLAACQPDTHEAVLDDYLTRIARVTGASPDLPSPQALPAYPPRRALVLEIPRRTIDVVAFFQLHGCDMGALVGFRNSPLGRLQTASQRLGYETAWLAAAQRCGGDAAEWIGEAGAAKRQWLPALFWNATFAADEMRVALGRSAPAAGADLADILRGLNDTLTRMQEAEFDVGRLEALLARLIRGSWLGPARQDWSLWRRYLGAGSRLLGSAVPGICLNRRPTPESRRLVNVFLKLYVQQIQPVLARDLAQHRQWVEELVRLSQRLGPVVPEAYDAWFQAVLAPGNPRSEWSRTGKAVVDHVEAWQAVFAHCNVEPVSGLGQD